MEEAMRDMPLDEVVEEAKNDGYTDMYEEIGDTSMNEAEAIDAEAPESGADTNEENQGANEGEIDYEELMRSDIRELKDEFPELEGVESIAGLENPLRYAALRDMGLSPREAFLASSYRPKRTDNRSHLRKSVPGGAKGRQNGMSRAELIYARELFSGMSDSDIYSLYKRVSR